jgi:hypothetical protein
MIYRRRPRSRLAVAVASVVAAAALVAGAYAASSPPPVSVGQDEPAYKQAIVQAERAAQAAANHARPAKPAAQPVTTSCPTKIANKVSKFDHNQFLGGPNLVSSASLTTTSGAHFTIYSGGSDTDAGTGLILVNKDGDDDPCAAVAGTNPTYSRSYTYAAGPGPLTIERLDGDSVILQDGVGASATFNVVTGTFN